MRAISRKPPRQEAWTQLSGFRRHDRRRAKRARDGRAMRTSGCGRNSSGGLFKATSPRYLVFSVQPITLESKMTAEGAYLTPDTDPDGDHDDIIYPSTIPFVLMHFACFAAIWTGVTWQALAICIALYWLRIFAIGAGYHRYFSHRAYSTSRVFQFVLAFLAQTTAQKSVLWWASKHRH